MHHFFKLFLIFIFFKVSVAQIVDYRPYQSPVKNQASRGTCTAFSICALLETHPAFPSDISEQHIYGNAKLFNKNSMPKYQEGALLSFYVNELSKRGFWPESFYPYNPNSVVWNESEDSFEKLKKDLASLQVYDMLTFKTSPFFVNKSGFSHYTNEQARNVEFIKQTLDSGTKAVAACYILNGQHWSYHEGKSTNKLKPEDLFMVKKDGEIYSFEQAKNKFGSLDSFFHKNQIKLVPKNNNIELNEGHAVTIVGYDENGFIFKNSWGESWGDKGYGWLSFDYHRFFSDEILFLNNIILNYKPETAKSTEIDAKKIYLKSLPFIKNNEKGITLSWIYENENILPTINEIVLVAYNSNNEKIGEWKKFFCNNSNILSNGCNTNINLVSVPSGVVFDKLVATFHQSGGRIFTNTYSNISAKNQTYTPAKNLLYLLD